MAAGPQAPKNGSERAGRQQRCCCSGDGWPQAAGGRLGREMVGRCAHCSTVVLTFCLLLLLLRSPHPSSTMSALVSDDAHCFSPERLRNTGIESAPGKNGTRLASVSVVAAAEADEQQQQQWRRQTKKSADDKKLHASDKAAPGAAIGPPRAEDKVLVPAPPPLQIALPYKDYKARMMAAAF